MKVARTAVVLALGCLPLVAHAQEVGQNEYMNSCAACHGADAKGSGPVNEALTIVAPDLTTLAARNGGKFPLLDVIQTIDGRRDVAAHGTRAMPVWGAVLNAQIGGDVTDHAAENMVRGRILALGYYLESIQQ